MKTYPTVTILEPWYGGSHRAWADGLVEHCRASVEIISMPDTDWRWRLQGSALQLCAALAERQPSNVILASSMLDVCALKGLMPKAWRDVPVIQYLHESQVLHPTPEGSNPPRDAVIRNWLSLLAADRVFANSHYHQSALQARLPEYLREYGDQQHAGRAERLLEGIEVLPVGVDLSWCDPKPRHNRVPRLLWSHRWEFDKDPVGALKSLVHAADQGIAFELMWLGESALPDDRPVLRLLSHLGDRVLHIGNLTGSEYHDALHSCDLVVSTATHETFGIAMVEALAAGCQPVFPRRLVYPELIGDSTNIAPYEAGKFGQAVREAMIDRSPWDGSLAETMQRFAWTNVAPHYDEMFDSYLSASA